jgi:hypothetical protein
LGFKHVSSLSRHKKKHHTIIENVKNDEKIDLIDLLVEQNIKLSNDTIELKELLTEQNKEFKELILDVCKQIKPTTITNINNTSNTNSNNKTFNLNVFLNETCKDAMNIMEFIDSIKLQLTDLESFGKLGFVEGISNIILHLFSFKTPIIDAKKIRKNVKSIVGISPTMVLLFHLLCFYLKM